MAKRSKYSEEDFYKFGEQKMKAPQIAEHFGVTSSAISQQLAKPNLRAAFEKGKASSLNDTPMPNAPVREDLSYEEIEQSILAAIDAHFCTELGIKNHAAFERTFDISEILNGMVADRKIRREKDADVTTAYFRFNWKVKRYWRDGSAQGKVGIVFESGDGVERRDVVSLAKTKAEIFRKLTEISELVQKL